MHRRFHFVVFSQACSRVVFELCGLVARELGPTLLHTGTDFAHDPRPGLTVLKAPKYDNHSYPSRLRTWSVYIADALRVVMTLRGKPVVMVTSNPPFGPFLGYMLHRLRSWPYFVRILDVYPDIFVQSGMAGLRHPVTRVWEALNRLSLNNAEHVITLGPVMVERVQRFLRPGKAVTFIPDWVDPTDIVPRLKTDNWFAQEHGQLGKLTIFYSGNLGLTHDLSALFRVAEAFQSEDDICFLFIDGGSRRAELEAIASLLRNFLLLPRQPEKNLPYSMTTGDVAVVTLGKGVEGTSMPSKTYHMMAAGRAILGICHGDNDLKRIIEHYECGINVDPEDVVGLREAILRFHLDRDFLERCRYNARQAAETVFSSEVCNRIYLDLFRSMRVKVGPA